MVLALNLVGTCSTWNIGSRTSCTKSCAKSCASCRTTSGPRPRQHWRFEASVIPTTRPPRGRSGSRDHTLGQLGKAGAGATRAKAQTESSNLSWASNVRRTATTNQPTTTSIAIGVIPERGVSGVRE
jgi:hypothetical protein